MKKKAPTRAERAHLAKVAALGCILCRHYGYHDTPAEVHHPRLDVGGAQRASHYDAIPLCPQHHRHGRDAVHQMGHAEFTAHHGISEQELMQWVKQLLGRT